jgi:hypothetical protein
MQQYLSVHRGVALFSDLFLDRMIYATLIGAALMAGSFIHTL